MKAINVHQSVAGSLSLAATLTLAMLATSPAHAAVDTIYPAEQCVVSTVSAGQPTPPALDLKSLEQCLRDTRALGVFTKLSLKNQVDELLEEFRGFHRGKSKRPLAELQQQYNALVSRVLTLLQDDNTSLAATISSSREAIWGILTDPETFAKL